MAENRFCTACGTPITDGNAFCTGCGARVEAVPAPAPMPTPAPAPAAAQVPAPAAYPAENILAVIGNLTQVGMMGFSQKTYSLVITDRRLIFALLTKEKMNAMVQSARDQAKAEGKGFFGQWGAQLGTSFNYHEGYWQMAPDATLAENPANFAVDRAAVKDVKFKIGLVDDQHNDPDLLIIKTTSEKYKLQVGGALGAVKDAFRQAGLA